MREIRVYNQVFRIEKTIHSIQGYSLPISISYRQLAFFAVTFIIMFILNKFPPFNLFDFYLIKFVGIPFLVAWFFTKKTMDGKAPHRFLFCWFEHFFAPHYLARYKEIEQPRDGFWQFIGTTQYRLTRRDQ